jgi:competence protein ComEC
MTGDSIVELLIVSHPHRDHTGALDWLINDSGKTIERIWWGGDDHTIREFKDFKDAVDAKDLILTRPSETTFSFFAATDFSIRVLNNGLDFPGTEGHDFNNDSLVFQLIYQPAVDVKVTTLFTGDIEKDQGEMLVIEYGDELKSDIVKIPHHGSDHLFDDFPNRVAAEFAYVSSTGTHGTFKHPRKSALDKYELTATIFCTCDEDLDDHHITVSVDEAGNIDTKEQVPYLVWERDSNGVLQKITITPPP